MTLLLLLLIALVGVAYVVDAKAMWGARRKKDDDADVVDNFVYRKGAPKAAATKPKIVDQMTTKRKAKKNTEDWATSLKPMLDSLIEMVDRLIESPFLGEFISPDNIRQVFEAIPQLKDHPEINAFFESEDSLDQESLKEKLLESLGLLKTYLLEMQQLLENPAMMDGIISSLPPEVLTVLNSLKSGDMSPIKAMLNEIPGLDAKQKRVLADLMDGKTQSLIAEMDPEQIEHWRDLLLKDPETLANLGLSEEDLQDPEWSKERMTEALEEMMQAIMQGQRAAAQEEEVEVTASAQAKSRRARQQFAA